MRSAPTLERDRPAWFAPFPRDGFWTSLGLGGLQFFAILAASCATFAFWGGPIWSHLGEGDLARLASSYALIPLAVAAALLWNGNFRIATFLGASAVIAILKLLLTAALDVVLGIALGTH